MFSYGANDTPHLHWSYAINLKCKSHQCFQLGSAEPLTSGETVITKYKKINVRLIHRNNAFSVVSSLWPQFCYSDTSYQYWETPSKNITNVHIDYRRFFYKKLLILTIDVSDSLMLGEKFI